MAMRAPISTAIDTIAARGVSSVKIDQARTDHPTMRLPPKRFASRPATNMNAR